MSHKFMLQNGEKYFPPKCWQPSIKQHGVIVHIVHLYPS